MRQNAAPFYVRGRSAESASQAKSAKLSDTNAPGNRRNDSIPSRALCRIEAKTGCGASWLEQQDVVHINDRVVGRSAHGLRTNVSTCQPLGRRRAVGSSSILASLRPGGCAEMPVSARSVEQAIPRASTLDWGGKTCRARASGRW
jgi:hypothetical protein